MPGARQQRPGSPAPQAVSRSQQQEPPQRCLGGVGGGEGHESSRRATATRPFLLTRWAGEGAWHRRWPRCNPASEGRSAPSYDLRKGGPGDPIASLRFKNKRGGGKLVFLIKNPVAILLPPPPRSDWGVARPAPPPEGTSAVPGRPAAPTPFSLPHSFSLVPPFLPVGAPSRPSPGRECAPCASPPLVNTPMALPTPESCSRNCRREPLGVEGIPS